ncbi:MAG: phosphoribosylaminoimidazolesuccinocarboxamide synthase [Elusimicrobiota bacterium]|nr:phosphoribosylaminoimidazolesuccinocarboxamide synthase [Elusimicrobiota bacterium]
MTLKLKHKGKVRELYEVGDKYLLMVASDRVSAFDFILPTPIPRKGELLSRISLFWFEATRHIVKNHFLAFDIKEIKKYIDADFDEDYFKDRSMLVKKAKRIDFECIVRGYITGSGWKEYLKNQSVCGIKLPAGLKEAEKLSEPIFTPSTKADSGHDENISFEEMRNALGPLADEIKEKSIALYKFGAEYLEKRGMLLADTKFEFGMRDGELILIDEVLTPDSSRFWDKSSYAPGSNPKSYDKQFVRDWLKGSGWDGVSTPPEVPKEIVEGTLARYLEAFDKLKSVETNASK